MSLAASKKKNHRSKSLSPSSINPYNQRTCKYRHGNKKIDTSSSRFECNDCKSKIRKYGTVYGCVRCKFYLCSACFRKPACVNGHLLKPTHVQKNTACSSCQYKSKKQRLQMYQCNICKYNMCLGCYSYETCCGNHGLKWSKITSTTHKSMNHCFKCQRIFKINKALFMCKKCKYSLCGDCYQPSLTLKSKIHRQQKIAQKIKSDHDNNHHHLNQTHIELAPPTHPHIVNGDNDGMEEEMKHNGDNDENRLFFDDNDEKKDIIFSDEDDEDDDDDGDHEEEEKKIILTDDQLFHHNNNYNNNNIININNNNINNNIASSSSASFNGNGQSANHSYSQSYHSYSHSNSHHSSTPSRSTQNTSRSKSRERPSGNRKKQSSKNRKDGGKKKKKKKKSVKTKTVQSNNGNTPSLSLSATSSVNMQYNDQEFSSSLDLSGLESCAPSEMTRIPSILTDCCICMEMDKNVAFLPCGHYIACEKCAKLLKNDTGMCAICSCKIQSIIKIYE